MNMFLRIVPKPMPPALLVALACFSPAMAQMPTKGQVDYQVGNLRFLETPRRLAVFKGAALLGTSAIQPGGMFNPPVRVSSMGILKIGDRAFDVQTGEPVKVKPPTHCEHRLSNDKAAWLETREAQLLELTPVISNGQHTTAYRSRLLNSRTCQVLVRSMIRGEDVDHFFEFGVSAAGWWLVGADEGSVLINSSGRHWQKLRPPLEVTNVLTARWLTNGEFWILANRLQNSELTPTLYATADRGQTWRMLEAKISNLPQQHWFEAVRELSTAVNSGEDAGHLVRKRFSIP